MKFGLFLDAEAPADGDLGTLLDELIEQSQVASEVGFDMVGMGQHYLLDSPMAQLMPTLGRLSAAVGDDTELFTAILLLPLHHPVEIAEQIGTLSHLVDGIQVGVGAGYIDHEFRNFGVPKSTRVGRLIESIEVLNRLWTEENVSYDGEFYSLEDATISARPETKPELWYGAHAPVAVRRAARIADRWITVPQNTLSELAERKTEYDEIRADTDKPTSVPMLREGYVAPTTEEAFDRSIDSFQHKYSKYLERELGESSLEITEDSVTSREGFEEYVENRFVIGSPEEICAQIEQYDDELDLSHFLFRVRRPGMDHQDAIDAIELFGDEVIPNV